jgi:hypothetical protein
VHDFSRAGSFPRAHREVFGQGPSKKCPAATASASPNHRSRCRRDRVNVFGRGRESRNQGTRRGRATTAGAAGEAMRPRPEGRRQLPPREDRPLVRQGASAARRSRAVQSSKAARPENGPGGSARSPPDKRYRTEPAVADKGELEVGSPSPKTYDNTFCLEAPESRGSMNGLNSLMNLLFRS